jgi:hypothetical protein
MRPAPARAPGHPPLAPYLLRGQTQLASSPGPSSPGHHPPPWPEAGQTVPASSLTAPPPMLAGSDAPCTGGRPALGRRGKGVPRLALWQRAYFYRSRCDLYWRSACCQCFCLLVLHFSQHCTRTPHREQALVLLDTVFIDVPRAFIERQLDLDGRPERLPARPVGLAQR